MFEPHKELPEELWPSTAHAMRAILNTRADFEVLTATAGFIYDRKGYPTVDMFGQPRNTSYGSADDDVVLCLSIRFSQRNRSMPQDVHELVDAVIDNANAKLEADITAAEQAAAVAQARVQELKAARNKA